MAVQLVGIGVTLPSVSTSLTPTTLQLPWGGESLLGIGVSIVQTSAAGGSTGSTASVVSSAGVLNFTGSSNSMLIPIMGGFA